MAIFIPKENTYETKVEKVRDNLIDRIEVEAVEVVPDNEYETPVYNEDIIVENLISFENENKENSSQTRNSGQTSYEDTIDYVYLDNIFKYKEGRIIIPKNQNNKFISKIFKGENEEKKIGFLVNGSTIKKQASSTVLYTGYDEVGGKYYTKKETIYGDETENKTGAINFPDFPFSISSSSGGIFNNNKASITGLKNETEVPISFNSDNLNYYIDYKILVYAKLEYLKGGANSLKGGLYTSPYPYDLAVRGSCDIYEGNEIEITIYGNTIGIDLKDKTVYIPDEKEKGKKPFSVEGNELMQTTNYLLNSGEKAIEKAFTDTLNEYINGKETITLRCSVNDYYTETGYKEISKTTKKERQDYIDIYTEADINYDTTKDYTALNTGIYADENTEFEIAFNSNLTYSNASGYGSIFGARTDSQNNEINLSTYIQNDSTPYGIFRIGKKNYSAMLKDEYGYSSDIIVSFKGGVFKVSTTYGTRYEINIDKIPFKTPVPIYMFALNNNGQITQFIKNLQDFKYFKIWQNGELVRNFVPCYARVTRMGVGLYDFVEKKYYKQLNCRVSRPSGYDDTNEEIVDKKMLFAVGDEVIPIPIKSNDSVDGKYKFIEYLENIGLESTDPIQYIDTGIPADNNIKIEAKFQATNRLYSNYIFGARSGGSTDIINLVASGNTQWYVRYGKSNKIDPLIGNDYNVHTVKMSNDGVYFDNENLGAPKSEAFTVKNSIYIFGVNQNGTLQRGSCKIYSFKIYQNNKLVRDFKPCYRYADQKLGMFDMVENKFYENANADGGDFKSPFKKYRVNGRKISGQGAIWQTLSLQEI